jgi:hypothetical protein
MSFLAFLTLLVLVGGVSVEAIQPRAYNNPLNGKSVDLFFLIDGSSTFLNIIQLGQIKIAVNHTVVDLNPLGSTPYFGVFFYGATTTVESVVPFPTISASAVGTKLEQKQFTTTQMNSAKLVSALDAVDVSCQSSCRANVARVTVIISNFLDSSAEARIRQLENDRSMTVIAISVGRNVNTNVLNQFASHPSSIYGIAFDSFTELIVSAPYISSVISSVPRFFPIGSFLTVVPSPGVHYTIQLNTREYTLTRDAIIVFTTNCNSCPMFSSLSEPNPTSTNSVQSPFDYLSSLFANYAVWHLRIPQNTKRFFFSFQGISSVSLTIEFNVLRLPDAMKNLVTSNSSVDLMQ